MRRRRAGGAAAHAGGPAAHLRAARGESELLSAPSFAHLHTPQEGETYAGGWIVVEREGDGRILTHDGSNTAWYAHAVLVPAHDLAVLVLGLAQP
mgnify:CR=1 FL=1